MSQENHAASDATGHNFVKVAVTLERPAPETLASDSRDQKFRILQKNSVQLRCQLIDWLKEQGLSEEVLEIGEPTAFNLLIIVCTPRVAKQLHKAPGVQKVTLTGEFEVG